MIAIQIASFVIYIIILLCYIIPKKISFSDNSYFYGVLICIGFSILFDCLSTYFAYKNTLEFQVLVIIYKVFFISLVGSAFFILAYLLSKSILSKKIYSILGYSMIAPVINAILIAMLSLDIEIVQNGLSKGLEIIGPSIDCTYACAFVYLFFIICLLVLRSKKLNRWHFVCFVSSAVTISICTVIQLFSNQTGWLSLAFAISLFVIFAFVVGMLYRFFRDNNLFKKMGKIALIVIVVLAAIFVIFALINASGNNAFSRVVASNGFLNKLFNSNRFMQNVNPILRQMFVSSNLTGFKYRSAEDYEAIFLNTGHIELELIKEGGLFGLIFIVVFGVFSFFSFKRYLKESRDCHWAKVILLCTILTYVFFETFFYDAFPILHIEKYHNPASRSMLFLICIFVIGYIATPKNVTVIEFEEKQKESKKQIKSSGISDQDYDFSDSDIKEGKNE